jgi:LysM repeat protein
MFEGQRLQGVSLKIDDPARAPLVAINFYLLDAIETASRRDLFAEAVQRKKDFQMFDKVCGTDEVRRELKAGKSAREIVDSWKPGEEAFALRRQKYLLYTDAVMTKSAPAKEAKPVAPPATKSTAVVETRTPPQPAVVNPIPETAPTFVIITVSKGDSAGKIADDFGISASDIAEANPNVNLNKLKVGQKLKIPRNVAK